MCIFLWGDLMIKRVNLVLLCLLMSMSLLEIIASEETEMSYRIKFDSQEQHEAEVIQEIMDVYHTLTKSVKKKSKAVIVRQHIDEFKQEESDIVHFEHNVLELILGDGKGTLVEGDFQFLDCGVEIETTSWLLEKLGW